MTKCPVCDTALAAPICPVCGYDRSRDYRCFPTFGPLDPAAVCLPTKELLRCRREVPMPSAPAVPKAPPVKVPSPAKPIITAIAAGGNVTAGLKADGTLVCTDKNIEAAFRALNR